MSKSNEAHDALAQLLKACEEALLYIRINSRRLDDEWLKIVNRLKDKIDYAREVAGEDGGPGGHGDSEGGGR